MFDFYKVGGSLPYDHPSYITRQADRDLYQALTQQEFCYVLNSRQMGKSSLRVRMMKTLTKEGFKCVAIDLGILGRFSTPEQWYGGLLAELWRRLSLSEGLDDDLGWWRSHDELSPVQRFSRFIEDVLLVNCDAQIVIFLDEIDNLIQLDFRDEFLILIRHCYEQRIIAKYRRLTFCLLGVATPSSLRIDKQLSPFNIGWGIQLSGFTFAESEPLLVGLKSKFTQPTKILKEILAWTQGQPFLTQKLCALVLRHGAKDITDLTELIQQYVVNNWEIQDEPEHLKTIRDRLLQGQNKARLLHLYQQILRRSIANDGSEEQIELRLSGLVTAAEKLEVSNPIYARVFDRKWVRRQLFAISPYQAAYSAWKDTAQQDESRLLRGNALVQGQHWAKKHTVPPGESQFIRASEQMAVRERQQAELARRAKFIDRELAQKKQLVRWQRFTILLGLAMLTGFYLKSRQANFNSIIALVQSSEALSAPNQKLDALKTAIAAKQKLNKSWLAGADITQQVDTALQQVVYSITEKNRLEGHRDRLHGVAVSGDGNLLATAATDNTARLWQKGTAGWQSQIVLKHDGWVVDVAIDADDTIATASRDRTVKLWNRHGKLLHTLKHGQSVTSVALDRQQIVTGSEDGTIYVWQNSQLVKTFRGHTAAVEAIFITPQGRIISASEDKTLKIWQKGKLIKTLTGHTEGVRAIALLKDKIVSASRDKTLKIWHGNGKEPTTLKGHLAPVYGVAVDEQSNRIVSASGDNTLKIWDINGEELTTLKGHTNRVWDVVYLNGAIASASWDETVRIWQPENNLVRTLLGHQDVAISLDYAHQQNTAVIASASDDETVKLWDSGRLRKTFTGHTAEVYDVALNEQNIVSVGADKTLRIWQRDSDLVTTVKAHEAPIWAVVLSPDGQKIITAGNDRLIKIWDLQGDLLHTFQGHQQKIWDLAVSPNGKYILSAGEDRTVKVWDFKGNLLHTLQGHRDAVRAVVTDGKQIISAGEDRTIAIWDYEGNSLAELQEHDRTVKAIALSRNGKYLASGDDLGKIVLWQRSQKTWQPVKTLWRGNAIWSLRFSPDSHTLATTGEGGDIMLWNLEQILKLDPLKYGCNWLADYLSQSKNNSGDRSFCSKYR